MRKIPFGFPIIGAEERHAVLSVLQGTTLVHGPMAKRFEDDFSAFTGSPYAVSVASCTAALHLAYFHLGLKKGDEVIVPAQTHTATAHAVEYCGAVPVFVDAEERTGNIDIEQIEAMITPQTKALSLVHYLGMPVNMECIGSLAKKYGLFVVEDCALALGTYYRGVHAGLYGDVGCFSFYPVKHMTTAEGGMLITRDAGIAIDIMRKKAFGVDRTPEDRQVPGIYDVAMLGYNYRMNELEAALGVEQLKRMPGFLRQRRENYEVLQAGLREISEIDLFASSQGDYVSSYYCLSILLRTPLAAKRFEIVKYLNERGVGTSVYYPQPVPHLSYYREKYGHSKSSFPVAARISNTSIALPVGPHLGREDMAYITGCLKAAISEVK